MLLNYPTGLRGVLALGAPRAAYSAHAPSLQRHPPTVWSGSSASPLGSSSGSTSSTSSSSAARWQRLVPLAASASASVGAQSPRPPLLPVFVTLAGLSSLVEACLLLACVLGCVQLMHMHSEASSAAAQQQQAQQQARGGSRRKQQQQDKGQGKQQRSQVGVRMRTYAHPALARSAARLCTLHPHTCTHTRAHTLAAHCLRSAASPLPRSPPTHYPRTRTRQASSSTWVPSPQWAWQWQQLSGMQAGLLACALFARIVASAMWRLVDR